MLLNTKAPIHQGPFTTSYLVILYGTITLYVAAAPSTVLMFIRSVTCPFNTNWRNTVPLLPITVTVFAPGLSAIIENRLIKGDHRQLAVKVNKPDRRYRTYTTMFNGTKAVIHFTTGGNWIICISIQHLISRCRHKTKTEGGSRRCKSDKGSSISLL